MEQFYKSVLDNDRSAVVLCDLNHVILYMNRAAIKRYSGKGGENLIGKSLLDCHNQHSNEIINKVLDWFAQDENNNMIYTFRNEKENKDVYMVALRDENKKLIGYYEKHEYRSNETATVYDFSKSLV